MKKQEMIDRYGEEWYNEHRLEPAKKWVREHREEHAEYNRKYRQEHREEKIKYQKKYWGAKADPDSIPHKRQLIRARDNRRYNPIRQFWSHLKTDIHHEWIPDTADYMFIALVERSKHQYGIIDPICILEGEVAVNLDADLINKNKI